MGRIFAVKRFEIHDGDGIRTTVFLKGCPLRCLWCHNPEGLDARLQLGYLAEKCRLCGLCQSICSAHHVDGAGHRFDRARCRACGRCAAACPAGALTLYGQERTAQSLMPELLSDRNYYAATGGGVTLSGGEPMAQSDFSLELMGLLKDEGISVALDTCGFAPWPLYEKALPMMELALFDVKAADPQVHRRCTGQDNGLILDNLRRMDEAGAVIDVRVPLLPGLNDGEIPAIGEILRGLRNLRRVKVLPYHHYSGSRYASLGMDYPIPGTPVPDGECLQRAMATLRGMGLNASDHLGRS